MLDDLIVLFAGLLLGSKNNDVTNVPYVVRHPYVVLEYVTYHTISKQIEDLSRTGARNQIQSLSANDSEI